ncbi:MAG: hypothetical protein JWQ16_1514, partial [Novosphingobium sp.]|nr:hypothetical protein [Novosphingobium sp.]
PRREAAELLRSLMTRVAPEGL